MRSSLRLSRPEDGPGAGSEGLSSAQARVRLRRYGPNTFRDPEAHSLPVEFLKRFGNPLVVILLAASVLAGLTGEAASFVIIVVMVLASVTLDFAQEYRAHRASERLRKSVRLHADVIRDGVVHRIRVSGVVPGDLVLLAAGSLIPADVGLSVDGAADVAREAADMILTRPDLRVLHDGVLEGRRTFANVRKYIMMGTSSNFGNMFSMAAASVFLPFLPMLPVQILLNNILYHISEVPVPLDRVDEDSIRTPQVWELRFIRNFMLVIGLVSSLFDFLTFYVLLAFAFPFLPWARDFGFETPEPWFYAVLAALVAVYLLVVEAVKRRSIAT